MIGFWTYAFSLMWGITGVYVVFPAPFQRVVALFFIPDLLNPRRSPDERILRWMNYLHFGEFFASDWPLKVVWVVVGLAPAFLFVTGALMWWNRVLRPGIVQKRKLPDSWFRSRELSPAPAGDLGYEQDKSRQNAEHG
jgi:hypothetical protein